MLFQDALNQFQHKPDFPLCIVCGNQGPKDCCRCEACSILFASGPKSVQNKCFLVLYSKQIEFIMELDLYHSTVTSTKNVVDMIFPIKADPPRNFLKEDKSVFKHFFGLNAVDPLYNLMNKFRNLKYSVVLLQSAKAVLPKYQPLMENWMKTSEYRAVVDARSVIAVATSLCNLQDSFPGAPAAFEGPCEHVGDGAAAEDAAKDAAALEVNGISEVQDEEDIAGDGGHFAASKGKHCEKPPVITSRVIEIAKSSLMKMYLSQCVRDGASDPTRDNFGHESCAVSREERAKRGIETSKTETDTVEALKTKGFAILDGRIFLDKAYREMMKRVDSETARKYKVILEDGQGHFSRDRAEGTLQEYLIWAQENTAADIFNSLPGKPLLARGLHTCQVSDLERQAGIEGERREIKLRNLPKPPYNDDRKNAAWHLLLEHFDVSRGELQSMVEELTGSFQIAPSFYMSSVVLSNSKAPGTDKRQATKSAGQDFHADALVENSRSAWSALGMITGPEPPARLASKRAKHLPSSDVGQGGSGLELGSMSRIGAIGLVLNSPKSVRWMYNFHQENFEEVSNWLLSTGEGNQVLADMTAVPSGTNNHDKVDIVWDLVVSEALVSAGLQPWEIIELELDRNEWILFDTDLIHFGAPFPRRDGTRGWHFRMHHYLMKHKAGARNHELPSAFTCGLSDGILRPLRRMIPT